MGNKWIATGSLLAGVSVALGAFAAHGLKKYVDAGTMDQQMLQNFETGARYQMYHAFGLIITGILLKLFPEQTGFNLPGWLFSFGILFFSGSLYLLSTRTVIGLETWKWLGPITPIGGLCFIAGWVMIAWTFISKIK